MSTRELVAEIRKLDVDEKVALMEEIWENAAADYDQAAVPENHRALVQARYQKYVTGGSQTKSWDAARIDILDRYADRNRS